MGRWTGSWLGGPASAGLRPRSTYRPGERLGLPLAGRGSVAGFGARLGAFAVDALASDLIAHLFGRLRWWTTMAVLFVEYVLLLPLGGQTLGMRVARIRVVSLAGGRPNAGWVVGRTVLMCLLIPVLITDRDLRGLHDRASGTVVVRD